MSNPWLKKNPFMSMWLSWANRMAGQATAQTKRQVSAAVTKATNDNIKAMISATAPASTKAKRRR